MGESEAVELVEDKRGQHDDHQWVRPKFVPKQRYDEHEFDYAVREKIERSEVFSATDETVISTNQVCGYEVPGIFGEFLMQNGQQESTQHLRIDDQERNPANRLQQRV